MAKIHAKRGYVYNTYEPKPGSYAPGCHLKVSCDPWKCKQGSPAPASTRLLTVTGDEQIDQRSENGKHCNDQDPYSPGSAAKIFVAKQVRNGPDAERKQQKADEHKNQQRRAQDK